MSALLFLLSLASCGIIHQACSRALYTAESVSSTPSSYAQYAHLAPFPEPEHNVTYEIIQEVLRSISSGESAVVEFSIPYEKLQAVENKNLFEENAVVKLSSGKIIPLKSYDWVVQYKENSIVLKNGFRIGNDILQEILESAGAEETILEIPNYVTGKYVELDPVLRKYCPELGNISLVTVKNGRTFPYDLYRTVCEQFNVTSKEYFKSDEELVEILSKKLVELVPVVGDFLKEEPEQKLDCLMDKSGSRMSCTDKTPPPLPDVKKESLPQITAIEDIDNVPSTSTQRQPTPSSFVESFAVSDDNPLLSWPSDSAGKGEAYEITEKESEPAKTDADLEIPQVKSSPYESRAEDQQQERMVDHEEILKSPNSGVSQLPSSLHLRQRTADSAEWKKIDIDNAKSIQININPYPCLVYFNDNLTSGKDSSSIRNLMKFTCKPQPDEADDSFQRKILPERKDNSNSNGGENAE